MLTADMLVEGRVYAVEYDTHTRGAVRRARTTPTRTFERAEELSRDYPEHPGALRLAMCSAPAALHVHSLTCYYSQQHVSNSENKMTCYFHVI